MVSTLFMIITKTNLPPVAGNLMYLGDTDLVEVPSFQTAPDCPVPPYPVAGVGDAVSGIVNGKVTICGGKCVIISITITK